MTSNTINDAQTRQPEVEGTLLAGRYRIVRHLGRGGMGSVWLAEDTQLDNKLFAVKMLPSILVANKRAYRRLKDEALVAMRFAHPTHFWNTGFSIYDFCKKNSLPLIVATGEGYLAGHKKTFEQKGFMDYAHDVAGVVCVSTKNKQDSVSLGLTTEEKCRVIPNATDLCDLPHFYRRLDACRTPEAL